MCATVRAFTPDNSIARGSGGPAKAYWSTLSSGDSRRANCSELGLFVETNIGVFVTPKLYILNPK